MSCIEPQAIKIDVTTNTSGAATAYTPVDISGPIRTIKYVKTDFDNGVVFTITTNTTGQNLWVETAVNASKTVSPRQATHDTVGAASLYAVGGEPVEDYVYACQEKVKIVIASGGNAKSGSFWIVFG